MVYGANGYSAQLIIEELIQRGVKPILAGRNLEAIKDVAKKYSCHYKVFDLNDEEESIKSLEEVHTLINCAGPFKYTAKDLIDYCISSKTNYLDITGEIPVFAYAYGNGNRAKENGIVILPGAGFDVIPTDCLAKKLIELMPDATHLKLAFKNCNGGISRGTTLTSLEFIGGNGKIRRNAKIVDSQVGEFTIEVKHPQFSMYGISIPWGDVFTAYLSTGIPNIEVYMGLTKVQFLLRKIIIASLSLFKIKFIKRITSKYVSKKFSGPNKKQRDKTETFIYGKVKNAKGESIEQAYKILEGYNLTAKGATEIALRVFNNELKPGYYTPSLAFGSNFLEMFVKEKII